VSLAAIKEHELVHLKKIAAAKGLERWCGLWRLHGQRIASDKRLFHHIFIQYITRLMQLVAAACISA
jgi:hypothetical protein